MNSGLWTAVDTYFEDMLIGGDPVMQAVLDANRAAGLRPIDVSPTQGKFLDLMVRISGARRILEIGTLGGYSTLWMARAMPADGLIVTLEYEPAHAEVARGNFARAGFADRIELRVGKAADSLAGLAREGQGAFDLVFIDADKASNPVYIDWAVKLGRSGTVVICDNVVRGGAVADRTSRDADIVGSRQAIAAFGDKSRFEATALQTVGSKDYDGFAIAVVK